MYKVWSLLFVMFLFAGSTAIADETGTGKPNNGSSTQSTTTESTTVDDTSCSWLDKLRGRCEE